MNVKIGEKIKALRKRDDITYNYEDYYKELMEESIEEINETVRQEREKSERL